MNVLTIITLLFTVAYVALISYYYSGWRRLRLFVPVPGNLQTLVTIIIPARNEAHNIKGLLESIDAQNFNKKFLDVIVVDDFSTDNTAAMVRKSGYSYVRLISLAEYVPVDFPLKAYKKKAIEVAIENAKGELMITTDADCRPGSNWLFATVSMYEKYKPVMIAGPVNFFYDSSFLGKFQTLDFLSLVGIAGASIRNGFYNLCNGANLAFTKQAFKAVDGYNDIDYIPTGDDMMLMHKLGKKFPGKIMFNKCVEAIVYTHTEKDFSTFWRQRVRWTSKSTHYEDKRITWILIFAYLFNALLLLNLILGLFQPHYLRLAMGQFLMKICIDTLFTYSVTKFFKRENFLWLVLPMQVAHVIYILFIGPAGAAGKYYWKGREVRTNANK